jgi:hypothetical protein
MYIFKYVTQVSNLIHVCGKFIIHQIIRAEIVKWINLAQDGEYWNVL